MDNMDNDWVDVMAESSVLPIHSANESVETKVKASELYESMSKLALQNLADYKESPIFQVRFDSDVSLYKAFKSTILRSQYKEFDCIACERFMKRYGGLALVDADGKVVPLFWTPSENQKFQSISGQVARLFEGGRVTKELKITENRQSIGHKERGGFNHMYLDFPPQPVRKTEMPGFTSLATTEAAAMLTRLLTDYKIGTVKRTSHILEQNELRYADKHKAAIKWLLTIYEDGRLFKMEDTARHNLVYRLAAGAFIGCLKQLRTGAVGTLLDDVKSNRSWRSIELQWGKVCNPTRYMRPTAAPAAGNIAAAERLFESLGLTQNDMRRRYLVHADLPEDAFIWRKPGERTRAPGTIFGEVIPKVKPNISPGSAAEDLPSTPLTFTKFVNDILSGAKKIEYKLGTTDDVFFFITGIAGTKPLMQWHDDEGKNLASWYTFNDPPPVEKYTLLANTWNEVSAIVPFPHLWDGLPTTATFPLADENKEDAFKYYHKKEDFRYLLCLKGVRAVDQKGDSLCLFPQFLKGEFHSVRSTIERYSAMGDIEDPTVEGVVGGICVSRADTGTDKHLLRITRFNGAVETWQIALFE